VAALDADVFDWLYAELRDCRDHCDGKRNVWITGLRGRTVRRALPAAYLCGAPGIDDPADPISS
jgi:hypothetical protein